jgi:hypothetical protein
LKAELDAHFRQMFQQRRQGTPSQLANVRIRRPAMDRDY